MVGHLTSVPARSYLRNACAHSVLDALRVLASSVLEHLSMGHSTPHGAGDKSRAAVRPPAAIILVHAVTQIIGRFVIEGVGAVLVLPTIVAPSVVFVAPNWSQIGILA